MKLVYIKVNYVYLYELRGKIKYYLELHKNKKLLFLDLEMKFFNFLKKLEYHVHQKCRCKSTLELHSC